MKTKERGIHDWKKEHPALIAFAHLQAKLMSTAIYRSVLAELDEADELPPEIDQIKTELTKIVLPPDEELELKRREASMLMRLQKARKGRRYLRLVGQMKASMQESARHSESTDRRAMQVTFAFDELFRFLRRESFWHRQIRPVLILDPRKEKGAKAILMSSRAFDRTLDRWESAFESMFPSLPPLIPAPPPVAGAIAATTTSSMPEEPIPLPTLPNSEGESAKEALETT